MADNRWPFGSHEPYLVASHHVDERDGLTKNLPRGKVLWAGRLDAAVFWRDVRQSNIIRIVGKDRQPPGGLGLETDVLDWMIQVEIEHVLFRIAETGIVYGATPALIQKRGWPWNKGQRPQRIMPLAEWTPVAAIAVPEIPDARVLVIGGPANASRAYGMGTDGGTHGWHSDGYSTPKAIP